MGTVVLPEPRRGRLAQICGVFDLSIGFRTTKSDLKNRLLRLIHGNRLLNYLGHHLSGREA